MSNFGERMRKLREGAGLTRKNMAFLLNRDEDSVEYLENGYNEPDIDVLNRLCQIFNVAKGYLVMFTEDKSVKEPPSAKEVYVASGFSKSDGLITKSNIVGTVYVDRDDMHGRDFYGLLAKDNSMSNARMLKGDTLIVCRQSHADNGQVVVAMVGSDEEVVRRYHRKGNIVTLTAESDNREYKSYKIDTTETQLLILGVVKETRIKN